MSETRVRSACCGLGLVACALLLALPLSAPGVMKAYDWGLQIAWIERFHQAITQGALWPQWLADADGGRGAPVFVYYPPLAYYIASAFRALTGSAVSALELTQGSALLLLYLSSYRLLCRFGSAPHAALLALACSLSPAVLFIAFRVHLLGATVALAAFPLLVAALIDGRRRPVWRVLAGSSAVAWIGWSHLPSLLMAISLAALLTVCAFIAEPRAWRSSIAVALGAILLGLAIAAAPLAPALFEAAAVSLHELQVGNLDWRSNFLFMPPASVTSFRMDYAFLSLAAGFAAFLALGSLLQRDGLHPMGGVKRTLAVSALLALLLTAPLAWPAYAALWPLQALQFPWRWLPFATLLAMAAVATSLGQRPRSWRWIAACLLAAGVGYLSVFGGFSGLLAERQRSTPAQAQWMIETMPRAAPEYRPRLLRQALSDLDLVSPAPQAAADFVAIEVRAASRSSMRRTWSVQAPQAGVVHLGIACFPGWTAYLDAVRHALQCDTQGLLMLPVVAGKHELEIRFEPTPERLLARTVSALAGGIWLGLLVLALRRSVRRAGSVLN